MYHSHECVYDVLASESYHRGWWIFTRIIFCCFHNLPRMNDTAWASEKSWKARLSADSRIPAEVVSAVIELLWWEMCYRALRHEKFIMPNWHIKTYSEYFFCLYRCSSSSDHCDGSRVKPMYMYAQSSPTRHDIYLINHKFKRRLMYGE